MRKKVGLFHISFGGPTRFIYGGGRMWRFEDHPNFGPMLLNRFDDPLDTQPNEKSPFWWAWEHWRDQGKRIDSSNPKHVLCVWDNPRARKR